MPDRFRPGVIPEVSTYDAVQISGATSVDAFEKYLDSELGRLDVLVNNAGIMKEKYETSVVKAKISKIHDTMETNFYGALRVSQALVPIMRRDHYGRIVNISSGMGQLDEMGDGAVGYRVSKTALNALTRMLATATEDDGILVNSMCPGWVRTDMGGPDASRGVEKGAETAVWLAMLPHDGPAAVSSATASPSPGRKSGLNRGGRRGRGGKAKGKREMERARMAVLAMQKRLSVIPIRHDFYILSCSCFSSASSASSAVHWLE